MIILDSQRHYPANKYNLTCREIVNLKINQCAFLIFSLMGLSSLSYADTYEPVAHCYEPNKPLIFSTKRYKEHYISDVADYKLCLKTFIEKQQQAAQKHQEAAQNALKTWNEFVKQQ